MIIENEASITAAVIEAFSRTANPRSREILLALVRHLHGFVREVRLTEPEFHEAIRLVAALGQHTTAWHNEAMLMSGSLGVSALVCLLNNGTVAEEERDLLVIEHAPLISKPIQVDMISDIDFGFDDPVALAGQDLASGIAWASREVSIGTTLAAIVTQGASTISNGEPLTYEPGVSARFLTSTTATIVGATKARVRKQKGMAKQTYRVTVLATLLGTDAERLQASMHIPVVEE